LGGDCGTAGIELVSSASCEKRGNAIQLSLRQNALPV
jgi:hypothetical protein